MVSKKLAALAALSLVASSTMATAQSAQSLSLTKSSAVQRSTTAKGKKNDLRGGFIIPLIALAAIIGGTIIALRDKSKPSSP